MARDYARIMTSIWKNREFQALDEAAQRLYLLLVTQPDISAAGILRLSVEWWAEMAADSRPDEVLRNLQKLEAGRFIVLDRKASEVLIRSFIRWDAGYNNPKRRPVIIRSAEEVRSARIAATLAAEFRRVGLPELDTAAASGGHPDSHPGGHAPTPPDDTDPGGGMIAANGASPQVDRLPSSQPGSEPGSRRVSTSVGSGETATHKPSSRHALRDAADSSSEADDHFEEFWSVYPRKVKKVDARKAWRTVLRRKVQAEDVVKAATAHADRWRELGREIQYIPHPSTWLRAGSYDDDPEPLPQPKPPRLRAVAGGHRADPEAGVYWEQ